jgi:hypothetical protein
MPTVVIKIETPPTGIEVTGDGSSPTEEEMQEELAARQAFIDRISPALAELPNRPPHRAGNVSRIELRGTGVWSQMNHYLLLVDVDIGTPDLDLDTLLPPGSQTAVIGSYASLQTWPAEDG